MDDTTESPRSGADSGMEDAGDNIDGVPAEAPGELAGADRIESRRPEAAARDNGAPDLHEADLHEDFSHEALSHNSGPHDTRPETEPAPASVGAGPDNTALATPSAVPEAAPDARKPVTALASALAGMQAGMLGVLCMLAWLGIDSSWDRRGFWRDQNLFASFFYGDDAIHEGFGSKTLSGLALYLVIYSLLGLIFGLVMRGQLRSFRRLLLAEIFALGWFYLSFHVLWKTAMPLAYLLYADQPMTVGHVIFGACLASFPGFLPGANLHPAAAAVEPAAFPALPEGGIHEAEGATAGAPEAGVPGAGVNAAETQPAATEPTEANHAGSGERHTEAPQSNNPITGV